MEIDADCVEQYVHSFFEKSCVGANAAEKVASATVSTKHINELRERKSVDVELSKA